MRDGPATTLRENVGWLRQVPLFSQMEENKLRMLAFASERVGMEAGQFLFRQGDVAEASYVIVSGSVAVIYEDEDGPHDIFALKPGDMVGELSLFTEDHCVTSAKALEPLQVLRIAKSIHIRMLEEFPDIAVGMARILAEGLSHGLKEIFRLRRIVRRYEPQSVAPPEGLKRGGDPGFKG